MKLFESKRNPWTINQKRLVMPLKENISNTSEKRIKNYE